MKTLCCITAFLLIAPVNRAQDMPLPQILIPGEGWKKVDGNPKDVFSLIWPERMRKAARPGAEVAGFLYVINEDRRSLRIYKEEARNELNGRLLDVVLSGGEATAIAVTPDGGTLLIGDGAGKYICAYRINKDGSLSAGEKYMSMRVLPYVAKTLKETPKVEPRSDVSSIRFDQAGRIYAATRFGVQVFDPTGRLCGVLTNPTAEPVIGMKFDGKDKDILLIGCGSEVFARKLNAKEARYEMPAKK